MKITWKLAVAFGWMIFFVLPVQAQHPSFEKPVFLKQGDAPLNESGDMMYPSPIIIDIDNDGVDEMVVGTIFGGLYSLEDQNKGKGEPKWDSPKPMKTTDGELIALNNW